MSDHDDPRFEAERLRSVDRPIPPSPEADARIRAEMLAAFDQVAAHQSRSRAGTATDGDDTSEEISPLRLVEEPSDDASNPPTSSTSRWSRPMFYAASAAAVVVVLATVWGLITPEPSTDTTTAARNANVVAEFCAAVDGDVSVVEAFLAQPTGERVLRALTSLESLSQDYADVVGALIGDEFDPRRSEADELLVEAGSIRSLATVSGSPDVDALESLAAAIADGVDQLPGGAACRPDRLRSP